MTRKHFIALAEALKAARPSIIRPEEEKGWRKAVEAVASAARQFNPRFNPDRFRDACGSN